LKAPKIGVPVQWWRSVGSTHTAFSTETFIDELATAAGKDPVAFRLAMLEKHPRHAGVLQLAADKAGWGKPIAPGKGAERRGRGVAVHESFNTFVAQVADVIRAQMEGGVGFGLGPVLGSAITLKNGVVEQTNFHQYLVPRVNEMPEIEVHIVPSSENPTGVGEPGVPPIAPALVNAVFAATGKRIHKLPLNFEELRAG
jgi:isoquinoline 1-oxidoreductase beta subunit